MVSIIRIIATKNTRTIEKVVTDNKQVPLFVGMLCVPVHNRMCIAYVYFSTHPIHMYNCTYAMQTTSCLKLVYVINQIKYICIPYVLRRSDVYMNEHFIVHTPETTHNTARLHVR